ncbi:MAG: hypothetical protein ABL861_02645 [Nitrosomonas sp.]
MECEKLIDVTIGKAIKLTDANRNTLDQHFRSLIELAPESTLR